MTFVQDSPARLRKIFSLAGRRNPQQLGDGTPLRCGLCVYDIEDERHVGRIISYDRGHATIRWFETGWLSEGIPYRNLRQAPNF